MREHATVEEFLAMLSELQYLAESVALTSHRTRSRISNTIATEVLAPIVQAESIVRRDVAREWEIARRSHFAIGPDMRHNVEHRLQAAGHMAGSAVRRARVLARAPIPEASRLRRLAKKAEEQWPKEIILS
jgi:hypothetical protein